MLETHIDTPDAYRPIIGASMRSLVVNVEDLHSSIESGVWGADQTAKVVEIEESVLGVSATEDPEVFLQMHRQFLIDSKIELEQNFGRIRDMVVDRFSSYFGGGDDIATEQFRDMFNRRLSNITGVSVTDPLKSSEVGAFLEMPRTINVNGLGYFQVATGKIDKEDLLENTLISHEVIHGMLTSARTKDIIKNDFFSLDAMTRNGILTRHSFDGPVETTSQLEVIHTWLMEASIEDIRQRVIGTKATGYKFGVSILRTLKDLDPELQGILESACFGAEGPAMLIGRLEQLVGPLGVEQIDNAYKNESVWKNQAVAKEFLLSLLPENLRMRAGEEFDRQWSENAGVEHLFELAS